MIRTGYFFVIYLWVISTVASQSDYSVEPVDTVFAVKPASSFVFYNYIQFTNHTDSLLDMQWERLSLQVNDQIVSSVDDLGDWKLAIQDPSNNFSDAYIREKATFTIQPGTNPLDKFNLQLFPHNQVGHLKAQYLFFPLSNPLDSTIVIFDYTATTTTSISEKAENVAIQVYPNPATNDIQLTNASNQIIYLHLYNTKGQQIWIERLTPKSVIWKQLHLSSGLYLLRWELSNKIYTQKLIVQ